MKKLLLITLLLGGCSVPKNIHDAGDYQINVNVFVSTDAKLDQQQDSTPIQHVTSTSHTNEKCAVFVLPVEGPEPQTPDLRQVKEIDTALAEFINVLRAYHASEKDRLKEAYNSYITQCKS